MKIITKEKYILFLNETYIQYEKLFNHLSEFICNLDFIKCGAKIATYYSYNKPIIENKYNNKSYLESTQIRHPIIEVINENYEYVSNNIFGAFILILSVPVEKTVLLLLYNNSSFCLIVPYSLFSIKHSSDKYCFIDTPVDL